MIDFSNARLAKLAIHHVGSQDIGEENFQSADLVDFDEELGKQMMSYFLSPFQEIKNNYHFIRNEDRPENEMMKIAADVFADSNNFKQKTEEVLEHLYEQSIHPGIKAGDVLVAYLEDLLFKDELFSAMAVVKVERKDHFIRIMTLEDKLVPDIQEGILMRRIDKAALILNMEAGDGYRVFSVDNNRYDAAYWKQHFLNIDFIHDDQFETQSAFQLCKSFGEKVVGKGGKKMESLDFINETVDFFEARETVKLDDFQDTLLGTEELKQDFQAYKQKFEDKKKYVVPQEIEVAKEVVEQEKNRLRSVLRLDTNIQIKLDLNNTGNSKRFIEEGYDDAKGMRYYKVYFNKVK